MPEPSGPLFVSCSETCSSLSPQCWAAVVAADGGLILQLLLTRIREGYFGEAGTKALSSIEVRKRAVHTPQSGCSRRARSADPLHRGASCGRSAAAEVYVQRKMEEDAAKEADNFAASGLKGLTPTEVAASASEGAHRVAAAIRGLPPHFLSNAHLNKQGQQQEEEQHQEPEVEATSLARGPPEEEHGAPSEAVPAETGAALLKDEGEALNRVAAAAQQLRKVRAPLSCLEKETGASCRERGRETGGQVPKETRLQDVIFRSLLVALIH